VRLGVGGERGASAPCYFRLFLVGQSSHGKGYAGERVRSYDLHVTADDFDEQRLVGHNTISSKWIWIVEGFDMRAHWRTWLVLLATTTAGVFCGRLLVFAEPRTDQEQGTSESEETKEPEESAEKPAVLEKATFGAGCFWCTEAVFQQLKGVKSVVSGYSGGKLKDPTYELVSTGTTGHAEVVQVSFNPKVISYEELLEVFWATHDPTTLNQQGHDVGTQYRSAVFYHSDEQKKLAEKYKAELDESHEFKRPIVTEITRFETFYPAEDYHQNYFNDNSRQPYCARIIRPKVTKVKKEFKEKLK